MIEVDFDYLSQESPLTGIPALAAAITRRAFLDLDDPDRYVRMAAWRWIFSEDRFFLFSLPLCCEILNYDITELRRKVFKHI
jgi:hypothetical protein